MNLTFLLAGAYVWSIVPMNLAFPLRGATCRRRGAARAWREHGVHALGGLIFLFIAPVVVQARPPCRAGSS